MDESTPLWLVRLRQVMAVVAVILLVMLFRMPAPTVQRDPERIPVRFWHMWTGEWGEVVNGIAEDFNRSQTKYEVIALSVPNSADSKFLLAVTGGDPPDVMAQWMAVMPTWAESGLVTPLDDLMGEELLARFHREAYPAAKRIGMYKGRVYGITTGINAAAVYYRPSHFRAAGLDPDRFPTTLEELDAVAAKLHVFDGKGELKRMGFLPRGLLGIAPLFGGGFYDWDTNQVTIHTPENVRALEYMVRARKRLGYEKVVRFESGLDTGSFAGGWPFIGDGYSATIDGQWRVEQLRKFAPDLDYKIAPLPPPEGGVPLAGYSNGNFMIIPRGARQPEGAWEFIKFWSGLEKPERAAEYYTRGGWLPLWPAVAEAPIYQEYIRKNPEYAVFLKILASPNLQAAAPVQYQVFLIDQITRAEDLSIRGILAPNEALRRCEAEVKKELARRRALGHHDEAGP